MKYLGSLILLLVLVITNFAQDSCKTECSELKHGLQFQIRTLSLTNYNGYTLAYRNLLNKNSGLRIAFYISLYDESGDRNQTANGIKYDDPQKQINNNLKLSVQYLTTFLRRNDFTLIFGGGPFISSLYKESISSYHDASYNNERKSTENNIGYGLDLFLGVEYNLSENVILSGEYGISAILEKSDLNSTSSYYYTTGDEDIINEQVADLNKFSLKGIGVNLGLSVYF